jgi:hypothetical protein
MHQQASSVSYNSQRSRFKTATPHALGESSELYVHMLKGWKKKLREARSAQANPGFLMRQDNV